MSESNKFGGPCTQGVLDLLMIPCHMTLGGFCPFFVFLLFFFVFVLFVFFCFFLFFGFFVGLPICLHVLVRLRVAVDKALRSEKGPYQTDAPKPLSDQYTEAYTCTACNLRHPKPFRFIQSQVKSRKQLHSIAPRIPPGLSSMQYFTPFSAHGTKK